MEKKETMCSACHGYDSWHIKHMIIRWLLGMLILAIVFKVGMRIGEFKRDVQYGMFGAPDNGRIMHYDGRYFNDYGYRESGMMPMHPQALPPFPSVGITPTMSPKVTK